MQQREASAALLCCKCGKYVNASPAAAAHFSLTLSFYFTPLSPSLHYYFLSLLSVSGCFSFPISFPSLSPSLSLTFYLSHPLLLSLPPSLTLLHCFRSLLSFALCALFGLFAPSCSHARLLSLNLPCLPLLLSLTVSPTHSLSLLHSLTLYASLSLPLPLTLIYGSCCALSFHFEPFPCTFHLLLQQQLQQQQQQ